MMKIKSAEPNYHDRMNYCKQRFIGMFVLNICKMHKQLQVRAVENRCFENISKNSLSLMLQSEMFFDVKKLHLRLQIY